VVVGLYIFVGLAVYAVLSIIAIVIGVKVARARGWSPWKSGLLVAVLMYLALFWDQIPIHLAHKYYCSTEGGLTIYKTLEEWKKENPGIAETLVSAGTVESVKIGAKERYPLNQRFAWDIITSEKLLGIRKRDERIVDVDTDEVIARYVDFDSNQMMREPKEFRDFKIWIYMESCEITRHKSDRNKFSTLKHLVKYGD
jgi:hypothetical protein